MLGLPISQPLIDVLGALLSILASRSLINVLGVLVLSAFWRLLAVQVPVVQVSSSRAQIRRKAQPAHVRREAPPRNLVNLAPHVSEIPRETCKSNNVDGGLNRTVEAEEEGHPDEVQGELNGV